MMLLFESSLFEWCSKKLFILSPTENGDPLFSVALNCKVGMFMLFVK
jgi:hypothetical protein